MLIKLSLVVAILAGLGALAISHFQVGPKIEGIIAERDQNASDRDQARDELAKTKDNLDKVTKTADQLKRDLDSTSEELTSTKTRATSLERRATLAETSLNKTLAEKTEALQELARWRALQFTPDQLSDKLVQLAKATAANDALNEEKKVFVRKLNQLEGELDKYLPKDREIPPAMPPVKGRIVAVDPKWDFVVLDVGGDQGLVERGELLVNRDGKLVAKVKVTSVQARQAVANVMPGWKQADVLEGDQVLH